MENKAKEEAPTEAAPTYSLENVAGYVSHFYPNNTARSLRRLTKGTYSGNVLTQPANEFVIGEQGRTYLMRYALKGDVEAIRNLMGQIKFHKKDIIHKRDEGGRTALDYAFSAILDKLFRIGQLYQSIPHDILPRDYVNRRIQEEKQNIQPLIQAFETLLRYAPPDIEQMRNWKGVKLTHASLTPFIFTYLHELFNTKGDLLFDELKPLLALITDSLLKDNIYSHTFNYMLAGAAKNAPNPMGPLYENILDIFLQKGEDINAYDFIPQLIINGNLSAIKYFVRKGMRIENDFLRLAKREGKIDIVSFLKNPTSNSNTEGGSYKRKTRKNKSTRRRSHY